ncbi:MAG: FAD-dependent oxidoreductase, partial [Clostridiales bacterium]|nr:FAD-dependent oxidoreductase [Clostridiales bacterium]
DGYLSDGATAYYERKALGGAASVATCEGIVDGELGRGGPGHICLDSVNIHNNISRIAHAVKRHGSVPTLELQHTGMFANRNLSALGAEAKGIAYGPVECELDGRHILPMTEEIIERTIRKFIDGAALAQKCGFGMVLVHAGHGWLLHQFLSPVTNTRTDSWGGPDIKNRARMLLAIVDGIHKRCGNGFPVEVRISGSECYEGGYGIENGIEIAKLLDGKADLIHVSAGNHEVDEVFAVTHPSMFLEHGVNVKYAAEIKKHVKTPVAAVGALSEPELMEEIVKSGRADVVELARQLLADPDFPIKIRTGREDSVKKCMRCLSCFSSELTNGEPYCAINPETGRELEMKYALAPVKRQKKILVIGGGIGGMQAALTAAERGHRVILCEKSESLGGVLRCEKDVEFKKNLDYYLNQQERFVKESRIDLRLKTDVAPEYAKAQNADVIIVSIGAKPVVPRIPGIEKAVQAQEAYTAVHALGQNIVILGGGLVGIELGLHLLSRGKNVTVVEMADRMSDGGNFLHMPGVRAEIKKRGLDVQLRTEAKEIKDGLVICETPEGEKSFPADSVVCAVGQRPLTGEAMAFNDCAPEVFYIGD